MNIKKTLLITLGLLVTGLAISQVLSLTTLQSGNVITAQELNDNFNFLKAEIDAAKAIAESNSGSTYTGRLDDEVFITANQDSSTNFYCPHLLNKDGNVVQIGSSCEWTESYNGFFYKGKYYFGAYENSNGNLDWMNSKLVSFDPSNPSVTTTVDINGPGNDDGYAYSGTHIINDKVYLIMNWNDLYKFDGTNLTLLDDTALNSVVLTLRLGDTIYYRGNPDGTGNKIAALNTLNDTISTFDFTAAALPGLNAPTIVAADYKSNLLFLQHINSDDGTIDLLIFNPSAPVGTGNPYIMLDNYGLQSGGDNVLVVGTTKNTVFYHRNYRSNPACTNQDCETKYFAYDKRTGVETELITAQNVGNRGPSRQTNYNLNGSVLTQNGDDVLISVVDGLANNGSSTGVSYLRYNETSKTVTNITTGLDLANYPQDIKEAYGNIYVQQYDGATGNQSMYKISSDLTSITKVHDNVYDVLELNGEIYCMGDVDGNGEYTLYKMASDETLTEHHDFTSDTSDPETWTDPNREMIKQ